jgi:adenine-specific DNA-methyltransferase
MEQSMQFIDETSPLAQSANIEAGNLDKLIKLFPEVIAYDDEGTTVNIDVLRALVGDKLITDGDEKYGMNWHGKRRARQLALTSSLGTLRPRPVESVNWDSTKNLMIEGDNLEVLKLLQKSYANKVKVIYIDPPYNTGKDFIYKDNFQNNIRSYLEQTKQIEDGNKVSSDSEARGRTHTDWLNMMYPRLKLARNLLRDDGAIFISIDDGEVANLRAMCDEIFGEENFIATIVWQKKYAPQNDATYFSDMHDYIVVYAKMAKQTKSDPKGWSLDLLPRTQSQDAAYKNPDNDPRGVWKSGDLSVKTYSKKNDYPITTPSGRVVSPPKTTCWRVSNERYEELLADNRIWFGNAGTGVPSLKRFLSDVQDGSVPVTWWPYKDAGHNQDAKKELKALFDDADTIFDTPKPVKLMSRILQLTTTSDKNAIVMDFFAGSGAIGQAVYEMNGQDGGNRRFILVQLPEPIKDSKLAISDLTKERLRRSALKVQSENSLNDGDLGFRVFSLDSSNIRAWNPEPDNLEQALLSDQDHIIEGRSEFDVMHELLIKLGLDLCVPVEKRTIALKEVYAIGEGAPITCLAAKIGRGDVEEIARGILVWRDELDPASETTVVFRDSAFEDDVAKTNMAAILEQSGLKNVRSI